MSHKTQSLILAPTIEEVLFNIAVFAPRRNHGSMTRKVCGVHTQQWQNERVGQLQPSGYFAKLALDASSSGYLSTIKMKNHRRLPFPPAPRAKF
jgi:hypothetical protein